MEEILGIEINIIFLHNKIAILFRIMEAIVATVNQKRQLHKPTKKKLSAPWIRSSYFHVFSFAETEYDLGFIPARLDFLYSQEISKKTKEIVKSYNSLLNIHCMSL